ncbi:MAG TPA: helix-turn-helix transcriptional regulator [Streptosporangiaceae bacterium]
MPDYTSPSARGWRLAAELRRLRERTGMSGIEVAERLEWSGSKVSRIELQRTGVKRADLDKLLDLYEVEEPNRGELLALADEAVGKGPLEAVTAGFPAEYAEYVKAEAEASSVWNWEPQIVPGLLQVPEYSRAVMAGMQSMFVTPPGDVERRIEARLLRQQRLSGEHPLELAVVIDESVLHRRYGEPGVMRRQLERLTADSRRPNVDLRILPLDGSHPIHTGAFAYMRFPRIHQVTMRDLVSVEHLDGSYYLEEEADTHRYLVAFQNLQAQALGQVQSRRLISDITQRVWS